MRFHVRRADMREIDVLVPLFDEYRQFYRQPSNVAHARTFLADRLEQRQSVVLLAWSDDGRGVGFAQLYPLFSSVRMVRIYLLNDLFVATDARRQGVGRNLLEASAEQARELGAASLCLQTERCNTAAQALYESLGWTRDEHFYEYDLAL